MKTLIAATLVATAAFAGAASAMVDTSSEAIIRSVAPSVDISDLTKGELVSLAALIESRDSAGEKRAAVQAFLQ